jgi:translation initiation factor 3 subunit E
LSRFKDDFIENARQLMFETYCRVHQNIDIRRLSAKLNLNEAEGEKWIVNLIRNARLDAKIDSQTHTVIMGTQSKPVYQDLIERTKEISFRTSVLAGNVEKL